MWLRTRYRRFFAAVHSWMPLVLEMAVTLASVRMALLLLTDQTYFDRYPASYTWFVSHFPSHEWIYGILAASAAGLKAAGMLCLLPRKSERFLDTAFLLREIGWGLSVVFWTGLTLVLNGWDVASLGAIATTTVAIFSIVAMVSGPAMPEEPHVYEG